MTLQEAKENRSTMKTAEQLKFEINHIIDSGANDIRIMELIKSVVSEACRKQREICANTFDKSDGPVIGSKKVFDAIKDAPEPPLL